MALDPHLAHTKSLVLIASANPSFWQAIKESLRDQFTLCYSVDRSGTLDLVQRHDPALVIIGSGLLDTPAQQIVPLLKKAAPETPCLVITTSSDRSVPPAGADLCLEDRRVPESLLSVVRSLLERGNARTVAWEAAEQDPTGDAWRGNVTGPGALADLPEHRRMVFGQSQQVLSLLEDARRIARVDVTVLITGESGTGKEVLARYIHCCSHRARGPFEAVDLPSIPDALFESILFGHERGSFTGAVAPSEGKVLRAQHGTLFLDEISSLNLELQPKLLRVIQEKKVECVGGRRSVDCDVRIIAATNTDLEAGARRGQFRPDLYYRLNVITLNLLPLRERREDIPALLEFFLDRYAREYRRPLPEVSAGALEALRSYEWPGNIRELENRAQRALLLGRAPRLKAEDFFGPVQPATDDATIQFGDCCHSLAEMERLYINQVLRKTAGNLSQAAQILRITRKTLRAKLQGSSEQPGAGSRLHALPAG